MEFDSTYTGYVKQILSNTDIPETENTSLVLRFRSMIKGALRRVAEEGICSKAEVKKRHHGFMIPSGLYVPLTISQYIDAMARDTLVYRCRIHNVRITINYHRLNGHKQSIRNVDKTIRLMVAWLVICCANSDSGSNRKLSIHLYPCPQRKVFPSSASIPLGPSSVNSGYSTRRSDSGEIVVFREEEMFKVFVHETFHAFDMGLDSPLGDGIDKFLASKFSVSVPISGDEAYIETWSRIVNCMFSAFVATKKREDFVATAVVSLGIESVFASTQAKRVLYHNGVRMEDVMDTSSDIGRYMYKETTHAFAYYVITSFLLCRPYEFIEWCMEHNRLMFSFLRNTSNIAAFRTFLAQRIDEGCGETVDVSPSFGTRMSIIDLN